MSRFFNTNGMNHYFPLKDLLSINSVLYDQYIVHDIYEMCDFMWRPCDEKNLMHTPVTHTT